MGHYNITAAWAVDREFVLHIFLGVVGPMVPPGSPDCLGKAKTNVFFLRFFKVRSQKQWFSLGSLRVRAKNGSPIPAKSAKSIVKQGTSAPHGVLCRFYRLQRFRNIWCRTDPRFPAPGGRMTVVYTNSLKLPKTLHKKISTTLLKVGLKRRS